MVFPSNGKAKMYKPILQKKKDYNEDANSIDSNECVNDDISDKHSKVSSLSVNAPQEVVEEPSVMNNVKNEKDDSSVDSFEEKHLQRTKSLTTSKFSSSSLPHFMLPTESSIQRDNLMYEERQRKSMVISRKTIPKIDKTSSKQPKRKESISSTHSSDYNHLDSYSQLPRFMQPTQSYLQSLKPDPSIRPRKSIPSSRIREVDANSLPRYMQQTKASRRHYKEEIKRDSIECDEASRPREFVEPLFRRQPMSEHDEFAINELRRELEKALSDREDHRLSTGEIRCTAIKRREGDVPNEEEVNERVRKAMKKVYPRYMQLTNAYRHKYNINE